MVFIETSGFTKQVKTLLSDEQYAALRQAMSDRPGAGDVIQDTGGMRKLRWALPGRGKSGGVRVIYYWVLSDSQIIMLMIYPKSMKDTLSAAEKKALKKILEKWNG